MPLIGPIFICIISIRYQVVRRRLVWLLGNWVPIKFDNMLRPLLYRTMIPILHENEDIVVMFTISLILYLQQLVFVHVLIGSIIGS